MKSVVSIALGIAIAATIMVSGRASALSPPLDALLIPVVHPDETFRYSAVDRLSGSVVHSHTQQVVYRVLSSQGGTINFQREILGRGKSVLERDASGNLAAGDITKPAMAFFVPRQFLGDPPSPLAVGQTWPARLSSETALGSPGTASVSVVSIDQASRHVVLQETLHGEGDASQITPGDNTPTRFHTVTNRHARIELSNGIVDSFVVSGEDKQSANGSTPINVHVELSMKRSK